MWRHSENSSDFIDLELARFEELRLFRRDGDRRVLESFLQHGDFVAVRAATEGGLPTFPDPRLLRFSLARYAKARGFQPA